MRNSRIACAINLRGRLSPCSILRLTRTRDVQPGWLLSMLYYRNHYTLFYIPHFMRTHCLSIFPLSKIATAFTTRSSARRQSCDNARSRICFARRVRARARAHDFPRERCCGKRCSRESRGERERERVAIGCVRSVARTESRRAEVAEQEGEGGFQCDPRRGRAHNLEIGSSIRRKSSSGN